MVEISQNKLNKLKDTLEKYAEVLKKIRKDIRMMCDNCITYHCKNCYKRSIKEQIQSVLPTKKRQ